MSDSLTSGIDVMETITVLMGMMALFAMLPGGHCFDQRKRILEAKADFLTAKMEDIAEEICPSKIVRGTKRKREDDTGHWMDEGQKLVSKVRCVLSQVDGGTGGSRNFLKRAKLTWEFDSLADALDAHGKKGDVLRRHALSAPPVPCRGGLIPVRALVGRRAPSTLRRLELLVQDEKIKRIAIHGVEGVGKTCLMKHLYNSVLNMVGRFEYVFWVSIPDQCNIEHLQHAIAALVKCDFSYSDKLDVRARKLSDKLKGLASYVLFLDGVPEADFSLDQVGIPVLAEGCKRKLVLTTSSSLHCRLLDGFEAVKVDTLLVEEAYELFMHEAGLGAVSDSSLDDAPRLLAERCCGLPRTIVNVATRMRGIHDPHEWKHALSESRLG